MIHPNGDCGEFNVTVDLPYPPVQTESRRKKYAYAMLSNLGGRISEMSAVSLYFYDNVLLQAKNASYAWVFHQVSIVEMRHLHIFATLACQMGLDPRLWSKRKQGKTYWTPAYNCYSRKPRDVLKYAIQSELSAIRKYSRQAETICDANIVANLNRILLDEKHHVELFRRMLAQLS